VPNVQWKTPNDGQGNCPKYVEFTDKIKLGISASVVFIVKAPVYLALWFVHKYAYLFNISFDILSSVC